MAVPAQRTQGQVETNRGPRMRPSDSGFYDGLQGKPRVLTTTRRGRKQSGRRYGPVVPLRTPATSMEGTRVTAAQYEQLKSSRNKGDRRRRQQAAGSHGPTGVGGWRQLHRGATQHFHRLLPTVLSLVTHEPRDSAQSTRPPLLEQQVTKGRVRSRLQQRCNP